MSVDSQNSCITDAIPTGALAPVKAINLPAEQ